MSETFEIGAKVAARWYSSWFVAVVRARRGAQYDVLYGDGTDGRAGPGDILALAPAGLAPGDPVVGCWNDGARMFPGVVREVTGDEILVAWEDGSRPTRIPSNRVAREPARPASVIDNKAAFPIGTPIAAQYQDSWFLATLVEFEFGVHHVIYWDNTPGKLTSAQLRPLAREGQLVVGRRVLASWNRQPLLYGGVIAEITEIGAIIKWDDGTPPSEASAQRISVVDDA